VDELGDLDVDRVEQVRSGAAPAGTRAGESAELGVLAVTMAPAVLQGLFSVLQGWLERRRSGTIKITIGDDEIELSATSPQMQQQALDAFLARNSR
jgi:hypothetical protein